MGQKRSRKGKHFHLCIACCVSIFLGLCGCVHSAKQWPGEQDLREAKALMGAGDYSVSEKKTLSVLEAFPKTLGDEALFQMGLIYCHPKNPNADYEKSKSFFEKLVTQYPDSGRTEEAAVWLLTLRRIVSNEKETLELQKKVRILEQTSEARGKRLKQLQEVLEEREKEVAEHRDAVSQLQDRVTDLESQHRDAVSQLQNRVTDLESQLAKFKNIDLTIEQKKRATAP